MKPIYSLPFKSRFLAIGLMLLFTATFLTSCLKDDSDDDIQPLAAISFVHAAASHPSIGVYVDNNLLFNPALQYENFSRYITASVGNHLVTATTGGTTNKISEQTVALAEGKYYTVFIANKQVDTDSVFTVLVDDNLTAPASDKAKVRFVHLSPGTTNYDLYIQGGQQIATGRSFKSASDFVEISPAKVKFAARLAGDSVDKAVTDEIDIKADNFYTIVLGGVLDGTGTKALKVFGIIASN